MNVQRMMQIHDALGKEAAFNMDFWMVSTDFAASAEHAIYGDSTCGTCCCIGGTAQILMANERGIPVDGGICSAEVAVWLDISCQLAYDLFYPDDLISYNDLTIEDAQKAIRNVIEFNDPKWTEIRPDLVEEGE